MRGSPFRPASALLLALLLAGAAESAACNSRGPGTDDDDDSGSSSGDDDDTGDVDATWTGIQELLTDRCHACHTANQREGLRDLHLYDEGYDELVGVDSQQVPSIKRVEPGDPSNSYMVHKLRDTHLSVGGEDDPMPPGDRDPLTSQQLGAIDAWIQAGAEKN